MSINRVNITGNLTRDGELKATQGGTAYLRLGVAVNDRRKNPQTGNWEDVPNFVDCVMFGTRAEAVARYLTKGTHVAVEGRLRWSSWQGQDGQRRSRLEVVVDEVEWSAPRGRQDAQGASGAQTAPAQAPAPTGPATAPYAAPQPAYAPAAPYPGPAPATAQPPVAAGAYDEDIPF